MYKLIAFLSLSLLVGCDNVSTVGITDRSGSPGLNAQHYVYQGHNYIFFYGASSVSAVVHDPDCVNQKHNTEPVK